jgi:hypothetical protein
MFTPCANLKLPAKLPKELIVSDAKKHTHFCWIKVSSDSHLYPPPPEVPECAGLMVTRPPTSTQAIGVLHFEPKIALAPPGGDLEPSTSPTINLAVDDGYSGVMSGGMPVGTQGGGLALAYAVMAGNRQAAIDWLNSCDGKLWLVGAQSYELVSITT